MPQLRSLYALYLTSYNCAQAAAWSAACVLSLRALRDGQDVYSAAGRVVTAAQAASALETLHAASGLVRSGVLVNAVQFAGRGHTWLLVTRLPALQLAGAPLQLMVLAWAFSDAFRYAWAAAQSRGASAPLLTYVRYTLFLVAYPAGTCGEWLLLRLARRELAASGGVALPLPNALNFSFDYVAFLSGLMVVYPVLFAHMYGHMLKQRRLKLGRPEEKRD